MVVDLISSQVIQAIPNAIGALCLNEVGQAQLAGRPSIIPAIFSIFTSDRHLKILLEKENAVLIGTAVDELIRHHPLLKTPVFEALKSTLSKIEDLGNDFVPSEATQQWYKLVPVAAPASADLDVPMEDVESTDPTAPLSTSALEGVEVPKVETSTSSSTDESQKAHDNHVVSFIDILGRVSCIPA